MAANLNLQILLLGTPVVSINDQPLQIQRRLLRWMLFYLACQKEMVGRADLILLLWPDEPEEDARRHLRETLSKLRAQLPDPELILTDQDRVGLDLQRVSSDVLEFQSLFALTARVCAQTPANIPLTQAVYQKVIRAIRLWRSARFLSGTALPESESLNDWLLATSQQLETQRQRLLERLVDHDTASGDIEGAVQWLRLALEGDETNENLHYRLLNLLHKQGRYSEALNYCTYLQDLFRREGFNELPPSLLTLSRKIRERAAQPEADSEGSAWPTLADMQVPFVGRQAIIKELQFAVRRGSPAIVFGEAGAGKSRLVRELFFSLKPAPRLLLAPARKMEANLSFQPVIDLLRHDIQAEEWKRMDPTWVAPLSLLLPELIIMRPEIRRPQVAPNQEYSLIFEALRQLFLFLSKKQRFLLFLDNAQWSDPATLSALAYLAERGLFEENGALILAARLEEVPPHLESLLNRPGAAFSIQRLSLPPLSSDEIALLAHSVLGDAFPQAIVPRLERDTGGNPLFLLETLRLVLDYSFGPQLALTIDHLPLAGRILTLIRERLQRLAPYDAQVLDMAAIMGSEFSVDLLESTCMMPPEQVVLSLESLVQSNLIKAALQDRPSGGYTFAHEKIREVVLLDLSPARKRLLHLRIARAMEQKHQGQSPEMEASLANHYAEAGELNAAFQHWLDTALFAWRQSQKDTAVSAYQNAEQILQRLGNQASDISIYQLYRQWGHLAYDLSDAKMMEEVNTRLLQSGRDRQNPLLSGSAYNGFAQIAELRSDPAKGLAYLEKAAPYLEQAGRLFEHIEAANHQGVFLLLNGQYQEAQTAFQKALSLGERATDAQGIEARAMTEYWLAGLLAAGGWPLLALDMAERAFKDADETFHDAGVIRALSMQAVARSLLGRYPQSRENVRQGLAKAQAKQYSLLSADILGTAAAICLSAGDLDACWQHAQQALQITEQNRYFFLREGMLDVLGRLYTFLGDNEAAARMHRQGSQAGYTNYHALANHIHLGLVSLTLGDLTTAQEIAEGAAGYALRHGLILFSLPARLLKADVLMRQGQGEAADAILIQVKEEAARRCLPEIQIQAELLQARAALNAGQAERAAEAARQAAEQARAAGHLPLEIESRALWYAGAAQGHLPERDAALDQLKESTACLGQHVTCPELKPLLEKRIRAWTQSPETR